MKKHFFRFAVSAFIISSTFFSCSSDEIISVLNDETEIIEEEKKEPEMLSFTYNDITYKSELRAVNDYYEIIDKNVKEEYERIMDISNVVILVDEDGSMTFFDNEELLMKNVEKENKSSSLLRSYIPPVAGMKTSALLWDDRNFSDRMVDLTINANNPRYDIPNLKSYASFNDKCSSLKVSYAGDSGSQAVLIIYENDTYNTRDRGYAYYFIATAYKRLFQHANLKYIPKNAPWPYTKTWNDRISSVRFYVTSFSNLPEKDEYIKN